MGIKLIVFDLDGTLVKYENSIWYGSWDAVGYAAGLKSEFDELTAYYLSRLDLYEDWVRANAELLRGTSVQEIEKKIFPPPYSRGVWEVMPILTHRYKTMILSSGVDIVADRVRDELGIELCLSNRLLRSDGLFTGKAICRVPLQHKLKILREEVERLQINLDEVCAVGDNENDISVLRSVGLGVAFEPRTEEVSEAAKVSIEDFRELPDVLTKFFR